MVRSLSVCYFVSAGRNNVMEYECELAGGCENPEEGETDEGR